MPNLELYKIFLEVAKQKNITKASENLCISQPAVTRHIKNLEKELNTLLFNRTKGMQLTSAGEKLFKEISTPIEKIVEIDKKYLTSKEITFATYATMLSKVLSDAIAEFYAKNKNVKIITITDNSKVLNFPENGEDFDIAVLKKKQYDTSKYKFISLGHINYVLIANNQSKLCKKDHIKINDLKDQILYIPRGDNNSSKTFAKMIEEAQINIDLKRIDSITMAQIIKKYDNCVGEANCLYLQKELNEGLFNILQTDFEIPSTEFGIYYRKDFDTPELRNLIKIIKKEFTLLKLNYNKML